ncbi:MAG: hypothetical protein SFU53_08750 [Terrimicrobiaceae bacterium]|nr:hypothetical protein [Terrimicrobiaceae bacterium]
MKSTTLALLLATAMLAAQPAPVVDGLLPDTGGSGIPTIPVAESTPGGALEAMRAIPPDFSDGILVVTGRSGAPDPSDWIVLARENQDVSTLERFVLRGGRVESRSTSLDAAEAFRGSDYINPDEVAVDSRQAWTIAVGALESKGAAAASADYSLKVPGKDVDGVWTVKVLDAKGNTLGEVEVSATSGDVLRSR